MGILRSDAPRGFTSRCEAANVRDAHQGMLGTENVLIRVFSLSERTAWLEQVGIQNLEGCEEYLSYVRL